MMPRDPDADMCPEIETVSVSTEECMAHQSYVPCPALSTSQSNFSAAGRATSQALGMIKQWRSSWRGSSATNAQLGGQDKNREVRPGRLAEERRGIRHAARGARKHDSVPIRATHWTMKTMRTSCAAPCAQNEMVRMLRPKRSRHRAMTARRAAAGPAQAGQGSRPRDAAPPARGLDRPAPARLFGRQAVMASRERDRSHSRPK